jgi:excisionase family DNA binding protein
VSAARRAEDLPTPEIAGMARESAARIARLLQKQPEADRARVRLDGEEIILPRAAVALLRDLLTEMAQGRAVNLIPVHAELTTQQAADLLNVSRPHLVKLINEGKIPHAMVGTHRRIRLQDLLEYQRRQQADSGAALAELAQQAQELDLGY